MEQAALSQADDKFGPSGPLHAQGREGLSLPHSLEAEREVLAAVLVDPASMDTLLETLRGDDFYYERNGMIFEAFSALHERSSSIDPVTVREALKDRGQWEKIGGARAIGELMDRSGTVAHVEHYCEIVRKKADIRRMIEVARTIETDGLQDIEDVEEFLDQAERSVFSV
ncbi:MAG: replicative DNA helicase, partial [Myxococcota bacterium]